MNWIKQWVLKNPTIQYWEQRLALRKLESAASMLEKEVQKTDRQDVEAYKKVLSKIYEYRTAYDWAVYNSVSTPAKMATGHMIYLLEKYYPLHGLPQNLMPQTIIPRSRMPDLEGFEALQARAEQGRERIDGIERELKERYR